MDQIFLHFVPSKIDVRILFPIYLYLRNNLHWIFDHLKSNQLECRKMQTKSIHAHFVLVDCHQLMPIRPQELEHNRFHENSRFIENEIFIVRQT